MAFNNNDLFDFNNASLMGAARAPDVSDGGDRDHGVFGQAQSDFVADLNNDAASTGYPAGTNYGEYLQDYFFV
jgi:hypothetical protein